MAVEQNAVKVVRLLVRHGADVDARDKVRNASLHVGVFAVFAW